MVLFFEIKQQQLCRKDDSIVAGYARNKIDIIFDFDVYWKELLKYALFSEPDGTKYVVELGYGKILSCKIPSDILKNTYFYVSVFADDLLTTTQEMILVNPSGYIDELDDLDEEDIIKGSSSLNDFIINNKNNTEEGYICERRNRFERQEHPYV